VQRIAKPFGVESLTIVNGKRSETDNTKVKKLQLPNKDQNRICRGRACGIWC